MLGVSGDVERGAERLHIAAEEVRGSDDTPPLALVPVGDNHLGVGSIGDLGADSRGEPREHLGVRHVQALLEERVAHGEAHLFPDSGAVSVGTCHQRERRECGGGEC